MYARKKEGKNREGEFLIYCIEIYKSAKSMTGAEVMKLFTKYCIPEYVKSCFGTLHTTGEKYIVDDIDLYIRARQTA